MAMNNGVLDLSAFIVNPNKEEVAMNIDMAARRELIKERWEVVSGDIVGEIVEICEDEGDDALPFIIKAVKGVNDLDVPVNKPNFEGHVEVTEGLRDQAIKLGLTLIWGDEDCATPEMDLYGTDKTGAELCEQIWLEEHNRKLDMEMDRGLLNCALHIIKKNNPEHMEFMGFEDGDEAVIRKMINGLEGWNEQRVDPVHKEMKTCSMTPMDHNGSADGWQ